MAVFEKAIRDYVAIGGGYLSLTPLVGDIFLDRDLAKRLRLLESIPEITAVGVTTNAAMAHRFDDRELAYVVGRFERISISIYGLDEDEYRAMTERSTYRQMVNGVRRIVLASRNPVMLQFRLLKKRPHPAKQPLASPTATADTPPATRTPEPLRSFRSAVSFLQSRMPMLYRLPLRLAKGAMPPAQQIALSRVLSGDRRYRKLAALARSAAAYFSHPYLYQWLASEVFPDLSLAEIFARTSFQSLLHNYDNWGLPKDAQVALPFDAEWSYGVHTEHKEQCLTPLLASPVLSNGDVSFCDCANYDNAVELRLGNINRTSLAEMYASQKCDELWNWARYGTPRFCQNCTFHCPMAMITKNPTLLADPHQWVGAG